MLNIVRKCRLTTCILSAVIALAAAGCSGEPQATSSPMASASSSSVSPPPESDTAVEAVIAAADRTFGQGSFHLEGGFEVTEKGYRGSFSSEGDVDVEADATSATGKLENFPGLPTGAEFEFIQIRNQAWMRSAAILGDPEKWITFDVDELAKTNPQMAGMGTGMDDPRTAGNFLAGAERMREVGIEDHDGEPMTRYEGTVDFVKAVAAASPEQQDGMQAALDGFASFGRLDFDTTVWVDESGYVREIRYVLGGRPGSGTDVSLLMYSAISDVGLPVSISAPTENVVDVSELGG